MTSEGHPTRGLVAVAAVFAAIALLAAADLISDIGEGASVAHWAVEALLLSLGLVGLGAMVRALRRRGVEVRRQRATSDALAARLDAKDGETRALNARLAATQAEAIRWRSEASTLVKGLGEAIGRQLDRWGLTEAEREVALLLLKGLSHKEIARVRGTSDATTRQQARAVYKKAGLTGRNDLSAFFLEDLLLPMERGPH